MHTDVGIFYKTRDINIAVIVSFRSKFCDKKTGKQGDLWKFIYNEWLVYSHCVFIYADSMGKVTQHFIRYIVNFFWKHSKGKENSESSFSSCLGERATEIVKIRFQKPRVIFSQVIKVSIRLKGYLRFWYLYNILKCIQTKNKSLMLFCHNIIPTLNFWLQPCPMKLAT